MERRKVQRVGSGTYTVSLPKQWAESADVSAGDHVSVRVHSDERIVVQSTGSEADLRSGRTIRVESDDETAVRRALRAAYAAGYDEVVLTWPEEFTEVRPRTVRSGSNLLSGAVVDEHSDTRAKVQFPIDASEVSIQQAIRQLRFLALDAHEDAMAAVTRRDDALSKVADRQDQADRLIALVDRFFTRGLLWLEEVDDMRVQPQELFEFRDAARELERIVVDNQRLGTVAAEGFSLGEKRSETLEELATPMRTFVEDAVDLLLEDADPETAWAVLESREELDAELYSVEAAGPPGADPGVAYVTESLGNTVDHGERIARLGMQSVLRESCDRP